MKKLVKVMIAVVITAAAMGVVYTQPIFGAEFSSAEELIKSFEGFRGTTYLCPAGVKTIGYGFTDKDLVAKGEITREEADKILVRKVNALKIKIMIDLYKLEAPRLEPNELNAVVSFVYNVGWHNWMSSTMREKLICGDKIGAAEEFPRWKYGSGRVLLGLVRRRAAERRMFLSK